MIRRVSLLILLLTLFIAFRNPSAAANEEASEILVEVTQPQRGLVEVGTHLVVEGTARLPAGHHLWVFARRVDSEPFWWPQNRGRIVPANGKWRVQATIGAPHDVGWDFDIAVAVFEGCAHVELEKYRREAMLTQRWLPIEMPELAAPLKIFQVRKVSHTLLPGPPPVRRTPGKASDIVFEITQPQSSGAEVEAHLTVEGTAELPPGHHLWVFARRVDFEPLWWPQNEGVVDSQDSWKVAAHIGDPQDVGWQFDIAVAVFEETHHIELEAYRREANENKRWTPIEMPGAAAPPKILRVLKVRHE